MSDERDNRHDAAWKNSQHPQRYKDFLAGWDAAVTARPVPDREAVANLIQEGFPTGGGGYSVVWEDCLPIADAILSLLRGGAPDE